MGLSGGMDWGEWVVGGYLEQELILLGELGSGGGLGHGADRYGFKKCSIRSNKSG